ncbi:NUDIX domain-containing protein [Candidatus Uhrbacteria bacterium]|nr:NUDIX domain-containing protein [Candidatus Uhrbacteria bacterium]
MSTPSTVVCHDRDGNLYTTPRERLVFRPSVYGVIIDNGKILLSKQWGGYDFPGGGVEIGETISQALQREVKEETGLEVEVGHLITADTSFYKQWDADRYFHAVLLYYRCRVVGGALSTKFFDGREKEYMELAEWKDASNIEALRSLKWYSSKRHPLEVIAEALSLP